MASEHSRRPRVGLFVTCLVDLLRPSVGFAAARLIEAAGCEVELPRAQTCCGQPAYNAGDSADAKAIALQTIAAFDGFDYIVAPSGSCAAMLKLHYAQLMAGDEEAERTARAFAERVHELIAFLCDVRGLDSVPGNFTGRVSVHDSCSGLRELGLKQQPRELLAKVDGIEIVELTDAEACCGFGGLFSVKYPDISNAIACKKTASIAAADPALIVSGDLGCLINIAGTLSRQGSGVACRHIAEVLAGEMAAPAIAQPAQRRRS
jgi:L-lactate dehydrogenase complex protein LldE